MNIRFSGCVVIEEVWKFKFFVSMSSTVCKDKHVLVNFKVFSEPQLIFDKIKGSVKLWRVLYFKWLFAVKQWCRSWSCKRIPKSFDLSKMWARSQRIWAKKLRHFLTRLMQSHFFVTECINQLYPTRRPHACGLVEDFVRSSKIFSIVYVQMTTCVYFDKLKFDSYDAVVFSACLSCATHW